MCSFLLKSKKRKQQALSHFCFATSEKSITMLISSTLHTPILKKTVDTQTLRKTEKTVDTQTLRTIRKRTQKQMIRTPKADKSAIESISFNSSIRKRGRVFFDLCKPPIGKPILKFRTALRRPTTE